MKTRILGAGSSLLLVMMLCTVAVSQDQPQRGQRGQGGRGGGPGFGGFPGFGGGRIGGLGGAADLISMLRMEEVRKEVGLGEEGFAAIQQLDEERNAILGFGGRGGPGGGGPGPGGAPGAGGPGRGGPGGGAGRGPGGPGGGNFTPPPPPDPAKVKALNDKYMAILDEVLEPKGMERLMGLYVQRTGLAAATNEIIAKKINVTDDQVKAIKDSLQKLRETQDEKRRAAFQGGGFGPDATDEQRQKMIEEMTKLGEENRKASDAAVVGVLDDAQEKALADLKGAEFKFPEIQGFGGGRGGPGGQGGGQGGRGGRGARPEGNNT